MYSIDDADEVVPFEGLPSMMTGAPRPVVNADSHSLRLSYFTPEDRMVHLEFGGYGAVYLGPPGDETLDGHPLFARGLRWYGAFEILHSSWIRRLEKMNSVHPLHSPARYKDLRHFIITFHDEIFECIAKDMPTTSIDLPPND